MKTVSPPNAIRFAAYLLSVTLAAEAFAIAGTDKIAREGQPVGPDPNWPDGLIQLLNDPHRTDGLSDWFSEWPNDVVHYQFRAGSMDEVNALVARFAAIRSDRLHVRLSPLAEPRGFGWVSELPEGNATPVVLSFGDQEQINRWYQQLNGRKFGVMEFEKCPVAVPLTLTIYTRNKAVDLDRLELPANLFISLGDLPRLWHESGLKPRPQQEKKPSPPQNEETPEAREWQKESDRIKAFLEARRKRLEAAESGPANPGR